MSKTVLITNGRFVATLDLIRNFAQNGVKVIVAETNRFHYCALSNANSKNVLIPSPRDCEEGFIQRLVELIETEKIDLFIPAWEDVLTVSKHLDRFPKGKVFTSEFSLVSALHNKWEFSKLLTRLGFSTPATFIIKNKEDIANIPFTSFYLKSSFSRASEGTYLVKDKTKLPKLDFSEHSHIIAQEELKGNQFCTYTVCHEGKIKAHATYPFNYLTYDPTKSRSRYCFSFEKVDHPRILKFVEEFVEKTGYTGSLAFDIFEDDGELKILECNPRLTSGITLLTQDQDLSKAFFNENSEILFPIGKYHVQYFVPSLFLMTLPAIRNGSFKPFLKTLINAKELIFNPRDILPFLFTPIVGLYNLYLKFKHKKSFISSYSYDLDYEG